jgi:uncharacterized protein YndB with AHSA1/START domain/DNA-binding transcriptional ArsR family regulator
MDEVFRALADPSRRRLLDRLNDRGGQSLRELCDGLEMTRQSVSKHLALLEAANLVTSVRRGREKLHYLNAEPINEISERWINHYERGRVHALADLKRALEDTDMPNPEFVYTTYIQASPELVWRALTEPAFTERYWRVSFDTDWKVGSNFVLHNKGITIAHPEQVILEAEPYSRLAYTWQTHTPEWAQANGIDDETYAKLSTERRSKVTFEIEAVEQASKLTVIHDDFDPGSTMLGMVSRGWPRVLSDMKTLLESGEVATDGSCAASLATTSRRPG